MQRTPEPSELMDDTAQAIAYAQANFHQANTLFVRLLQQMHPIGLHGRGLDLGCGPADIPCHLLQLNPELSMDAVDGAQAMLDLAQQRIQEQQRIASRLRFIHETLPCANLAENAYHCITSNSLLHHLANPQDLWLTLKHCAKQNATLVIMDLARPASSFAVDALVETYAMNESDILREDFRRSLHAAYTLDEVKQQLLEGGLSYLEISMVSDRHWAVCGTYHQKH